MTGNKAKATRQRKEMCVRTTRGRGRRLMSLVVGPEIADPLSYCQDEHHREDGHRSETLE